MSARWFDQRSEQCEDRAGRRGGASPAQSRPLRQNPVQNSAAPVTKPFLLFLTAVSLAFALNAPAAGESFPAKPIRVVVPFPAGGGSDNVGRVLAQKLSEVLGQQVFVDNRAGAGGSIGTESVVRAPADGYTVVLLGWEKAPPKK